MFSAADERSTADTFTGQIVRASDWKSLASDVDSLTNNKVKLYSRHS